MFGTIHTDGKVIKKKKIILSKSRHCVFIEGQGTYTRTSGLLAMFHFYSVTVITWIFTVSQF